MSKNLQKPLLTPSATHAGFDNTIINPAPAGGVTAHVTEAGGVTAQPAPTGGVTKTSINPEDREALKKAFLSLSSKKQHLSNKMKQQRL